MVPSDVAHTQRQDKLPNGYVYLRDIDPTIQQDIRYAGAHNFTGRVVDGYQAPECILSRRTAEALKAVQLELASSSLSLKVYDCYRPIRAVKDFISWANGPGGEDLKDEFYPDLDKAKLFALGYISRNSSHSRGNTVDVAIAPVAGAKPEDYSPTAPLRNCAAPLPHRFAEGTLDFGTNYDCFSSNSHTASKNVSEEASSNRALLVRVMRNKGFSNYHREWWHFEYAGDAHLTRQNFPIVANTGKSLTEFDTKPSTPQNRTPTAARSD